MRPTVRVEYLGIAHAGDQRARGDGTDTGNLQQAHGRLALAHERFDTPIVGQDLGALPAAPADLRS